MHPAWVAALAAELARPEYAGLAADAAYRLVTARPPQTGGPGRLVNTQTPAEFRLTRLRFVTADQFAAVKEKHRTGLEFVVADVPPAGFPNTVRRELFDAAWAARGDT